MPPNPKKNSHTPGSWIYYLNDGQEGVDDFVARVLNLLVPRPLLQLRHVVSRKKPPWLYCIHRQSCGSKMFITDPDFFPSRIPDPTTKRRRGKKLTVLPLLLVINFTNIKTTTTNFVLNGCKVTIAGDNFQSIKPDICLVMGRHKNYSFPIL